MFTGEADILLKEAAARGFKISKEQMIILTACNSMGNQN